MVGEAEKNLLEGLDPDQRAAVQAPRGPVCVLAGAGTGKTRTITHRIAYLVHTGHVAAGQVLAVTFTNRAAGEMRTRLRALGIPAAQARTFHSAALRQLRYFWPRVVGDAPWDLIEGKLRLVGQAAHKVGAPTEVEVLRDLASEIEWAKASLISPDDYPESVRRRHRTPPVPAEQVVKVYQGYERLKNQAKLLDFDDLLLHTAAVLEDHAQVAEEFRERYRCFVVDEYQDVTPLQQRVLNGWLGQRDDLTVVGDANQTIYSFAGASPRPLLEFTRRFPDASVVRLERDYRSTPQVVTLANQVIAAARDRPAGSRLKLIGQRAAGPVPQFNEYDDEPAEANAVAKRIKDLVDAGTPLSEIAVLYRVNAQSEVFEQALTEAGIPYLVRGGERFFERQEVRQAMSALRMASADAPGGELPELVRRSLERVGLTAEPPSGGSARERWESLLAIVELAEELTATLEGADLPRFVAELETRAAAQHPPTVEGVTLASLHASKGLEWDVVFLIGLVDGTLPIQFADGDEAAVEEERRLLYVGVTRAREHLWLSWSLSRSPGGRRHRRRCRFLYGLIPDDHPTARVVRNNQHNHSKGPAPKLSCRICGRSLVGTVATKLGRCTDCPSDVDEELLSRLRDWRMTRAKELKVPAFVVFTDATLMAIAEQRPRDPAGLVSISGIGAAKLDRFGGDVLALVNDGPAAAG
ncbi:ATP-dependent DNA helicase UvrD2 [Kibdelosporangium phytohabitans]|uniref:ATP-dependent DNA helicase UvrD2 n=1 Tax=Kibdelosporangium phytohabitans TaxID=860235 RepID=A0A0N7F2V5_9PSEU|nr:ATP-dependent DNA helicase UvrD2 [Kibdelosporangium phytohabitans]ALG06887.1 ATP-dependent DNA helicase [Kibdelosporangium phytohabitans]MBE1468138.1 DNA helicase-2/ATP-dependent DNA helicase PcrA [Kibdelosporangium phytohabitans]